MVTAALFKANGHVKVSVIGKHAPSVKTQHGEIISDANMAAYTATKRCARVAEVALSSSRNVEAYSESDGNGGVSMSVRIRMWQVQIACQRMLSRGGLVKKRFIRDDLRGVLEPLL
jgi:hypothetical protein